MLVSIIDNETSPSIKTVSKTLKIKKLFLVKKVYKIEKLCKYLLSSKDIASTALTRLIESIAL